MENDKFKKYIKYGVLGSFAFGLTGLLLMILGTKSIVCCNFINYAGCKEGKKEE
jgi:hypothetical protein